jgi:hypothetical protein
VTWTETSPGVMSFVCDLLQWLVPPGGLSDVETAVIYNTDGFPGRAAGDLARAPLSIGGSALFDCAQPSDAPKYDAECVVGPARHV